jgi:hypothetical protein
VNIPSYQLTIWAVTILTKFVLLAVIIAKRERRYRAFTAYIAFSSLGSVWLYTVNASAGGAAYFWAYWSKQAIDAGLLLWVVYEVFCDLFHPIWTMPRRTRDAAIYIFVPALACLTVAAVMTPSSLPECFLRTAQMYSRTMVLNSLLSVVAMIALAKYFMIPWRPRTRGIVSGLTFSLAIQSFVAVSKSFAGISESQILGTIGMLADLSGIAVWTATFSIRESESGYLRHATKAQLHSEVLELKRTVHASFGTTRKRSERAVFTESLDEFKLSPPSEQLTKGSDL